eukprot:scaffold1924_cov197-Alexandrium_tamarense.AAC.5
MLLLCYAEIHYYFASIHLTYSIVPLSSHDIQQQRHHSINSSEEGSHHHQHQFSIMAASSIDYLDKSNTRLKHRKSVEKCTVDSNDTELLKKHSSLEFEEESKGEDAGFADALVSDKLLDRPAYPTLPLFRGKCYLSENELFSNQGIYRDILWIIISLSVVFIFPLILWDGYPDEFEVRSFFRHTELVWCSLLHISTWPIVALSLVVASLVPMTEFIILPSYLSKPLKSSRWLSYFVSSPSVHHWKIAIVLSLILTLTVSTQLFLQMAFPSLLWNPFMWGWYTVYLPKDANQTIQRGCFSNPKDASNSQPLCLTEHEWSQLSSGTLSSRNPDDVATVLAGLHYLKSQSGGLVINALARNVVNSIPALRQNMEGLLPVLNDNNAKMNLSLVIFENDSEDGTRDAFKQWAQEEADGKDRYTLDIIQCGDKNPDCRLNIVDRYEVMPSFGNPTASGVGKLGDFRQIAMNHILSNPQYDNYSHMIVLDVDLGVSISPLGLLHTLGLENAELSQTHVIASSSRQSWPGSFGSVVPPYDLSAYRPKKTDKNQRLRRMHRQFCELMPKGDRWRNMCDAASPMQLFLVRSDDDFISNKGRPYEVESAFNGLTIYPLPVIREKGKEVFYDAGDDNQRCEHISINLALNDHMYVNPKWKMNLKPNKPGGPSGIVVVKTILLTFFARVPVITSVLVGNWLFFALFFMSCWIVTMSARSICKRLELEKNQQLEEEV